VDFHIEHTIEAGVEAVAAALLDPAYQDSLDGIGALGAREVLSQEEQADGVVVRRVRCVLGIDPGPAKRFLGGGEPAWVESARWDPRARGWRWDIEPEVGASLLDAGGSVELESDGDDRTLRRVTGSVNVKVPVYGSKVERIIVDGLKSAYDDEARRLSKWVANSQSPGGAA
jgi:Protein of unknown function (DUF2505)